MLRCVYRLLELDGTIRRLLNYFDRRGGGGGGHIWEGVFMLCAGDIHTTLHTATSVGGAGGAGAGAAGGVASCGVGSKCPIEGNGGGEYRFFLYLFHISFSLLSSCFP